MTAALDNFLRDQGLSLAFIQTVNLGLSILLVVILFSLAVFAARRLLVPALETLVQRSSNRWDDKLANRGFFRQIGHLLPLVMLYALIEFFFAGQPLIGSFIKRLTLAFLVIVSVRGVMNFLDAALDVYNDYDREARLPVRGYLEVIKIVASVLAAIFVVAILIDQSPWGIMSVLGGLTAVLLLIFKDTILGFVASIQLSANKMVLVGDWIEMAKYGADGDVIDVSIHTVKVRNWDKTITTIPTYALVSNSFKNWRGMSESGGRRIKRSILIDLCSIRFCSPEMLERFRRFEHLKEYIDRRQQEIDRHNRQHRIDTSTELNGRRQTNIGLFRAYVIANLKANPKIHQDMTFLVRQLAPTPQGLPLEIYVFCNDQVWANYEAVQADIFDHLLAAVPLFDLRVFQYPSGFDLSRAVSAGQPPS